MLYDQNELRLLAKVRGKVFIAGWYTLVFAIATALMIIWMVNSDDQLGNVMLFLAAFVFVVYMASYVVKLCKWLHVMVRLQRSFQHNDRILVQEAEYYANHGK